MNVNERDRLAGALAALRPDWAGSGIDRHKAIRTWLTNNAMEWAFHDALIRMALCAIEPTTVTPARALTDGPWMTVLRYATGATTGQPLTVAELGGECGICDVRQAMHRGARILSADIGEHPWVAAPEYVPASAAGIALARAHRTTTEGDDHE